MIDSHCHFDFAVFDEDRQAIWQRCQALGVQGLIVPGTQPKQWPIAQAISKQYAGIFTSCGLHPHFISDFLAHYPASNLLPLMRDFIANNSVVAIGECGLDKGIAIDKQTQEQFLEEQIALACELELPLILHVYGKHNAIQRLLNKYQPAQGGVIHAFSGSLDLAQYYWRMGFYLGVGGTITYPRANKTRQAIAQMPLEALLLETDAPDMPLDGFQGQRNSPERLPLIAQALADLKGISLEEVQQQTLLNTQALFFPHGL